MDATQIAVGGFAKSLVAGTCQPIRVLSSLQRHAPRAFTVVFGTNVPKMPRSAAKLLPYLS
jgi:hypothetical protein